MIRVFMTLVAVFGLLVVKEVKAQDYLQWLVCDSCTSQQQAEWTALAAHGNKKGEMLYGVVNTQTSQLVWVTVAWQGSGVPMRITQLGQSPQALPSPATIHATLASALTAGYEVGSAS